MFCPKCGADASDQPNYCRKCGSNLALVGKAVTIGETIARGDGGLVPKLKSMMGDMKLDAVSEQVGRTFDRLQVDIAGGVRSASDWRKNASRTWFQKPTPEERRAKLFERGFVSFFSGLGLITVLYYFARSMVLHIPPDAAARIPFEIEPLARIAWMLGLVPTLAGIGKIFAGLAVGKGRGPEKEIEEPPAVPALAPPQVSFMSVTEHTTNLLDRENVDVEHERPPNVTFEGQ